MFASDNEEDEVYEPGEQQKGQLPDEEMEWQGQDGSDTGGAADNGDAALHTGLQGAPSYPGCLALPAFCLEAPARFRNQSTLKL